MANFPASFDTLTNPAAGDPLSSPSHATQHATANDILELLETHVGLSGTSFPGSPATGATFRRTDRNLDYYYDGTRWLTTQIFPMTFEAEVALPATATFSMRGVPRQSEDVYIEDLRGAAFVGGTNDASNRWDFTIFKTNGAVNTAIVNAFGSFGGGSNAWFGQTPTVVVAERVVTAAHGAFEFIATKVGSPAALRERIDLFYRRVG